jgi:hypothetical protein
MYSSGERDGGVDVKGAMIMDGTLHAFYYFDRRTRGLVIDKDWIESD